MANKTLLTKILLTVLSVPLMLLIAAFLWANLVTAPNKAKTMIARGKARILGRAILRYQSVSKTTPTSVSVLEPYLSTGPAVSALYTWSKATNGRDDPTNYFVFTIPAESQLKLSDLRKTSSNAIEKMLARRTPLGNELQAGFCRLDDGTLIVIGIGPWNKPVWLWNGSQILTPNAKDAFPLPIEDYLSPIGDTAIRRQLPKL